VRLHVLDAAIIKVMKSRRSASVETIHADTTDRLRLHFAPDLRILRKRLADLVDREFLEVNSKGGVYVYVD
jgi:hypothetical protein